MTYVAEGHLTVQRVKGITGIHEQDSLGIFMGEDGPHSMDGRLDAGNLACAELLWASSILEIVLGGKQDCLCDDSSWSLTYSNRPDAWTLVEGSRQRMFT